MVATDGGGPYSKLGGPSFEHMTPASSMLQPSYMSDSLNRNYYFASDTSPQPLGVGGGVLRATQPNTSPYYMESMMTAGNQAYEQVLGASAVSPFPMAGGHFGGPVSSVDGFRPARPSSNPFDSANGHYSSFYTNQPDVGAGEQQVGAGAYAHPTTPGVMYDTNSAPSQYQYQQAQFQQHQQHQQQQQPQPQPQWLQPSHRYGTYVSGTPSQSGPTTTHYSYSSADTSQLYPASLSEPQQRQQQFNSTLAHETTRPMSAASNSVHFNADQLVAAASWDEPVEFARRRPVFSDSRRSGAVSLKLDENTRQMLKQQLQAEPSAMSSRVNLDRRVITFKDQPAAAAAVANRSEAVLARRINSSSSSNNNNNNNSNNHNNHKHSYSNKQAQTEQEQPFVPMPSVVQQSAPEQKSDRSASRWSPDYAIPQDNQLAATLPPAPSQRRR
jgi:hypothetical protein